MEIYLVSTANRIPDRRGELSDLQGQPPGRTTVARVHTRQAPREPFASIHRASMHTSGRKDYASGQWNTLAVDGPHLAKTSLRDGRSGSRKSHQRPCSYANSNFSRLGFPFRAFVSPENKAAASCVSAQGATSYSKVTIE